MRVLIYVLYKLQVLWKYDEIVQMQMAVTHTRVFILRFVCM
jgi:hypothetical protein